MKAIVFQRIIRLHERCTVTVEDADADITWSTKNTTNFISQYQWFTMSQSIPQTNDVNWKWN